MFSKLKENYLDHGVDGLWFDEAEPEIHPEHFDNLLFHIGRGDEVGLLYPYYYAQMAFDGFMKMGKVPVTLIRAAYPGAQKFGALVWSGDIPSTFESLSQQVKAGLNMAMCGIPWWNTDIGGFWRYRKRGLPRTDRALVPVRRILSGDARPRQPKPPRRKDARCERADRRPE